MAQSRNFQIEVAVNCDSVFELPAAIICDQLSAFRFRKIDIRIVEQRREIVVRQGLVAFPENQSD